MKGKREFNTEQRWRFLARVDIGKNQADYFYNKINGWTNQYKKYSTSGLASSAKYYFEGLDKTLSKSKQDINKIFESAEAVENNFAGKFENIAFEMSLYTDRINALSKVLRPTGLATNVFTAPDFAERLERVKEEYLEKEIQALIANPDLLEHYIESSNIQDYIDFINDKYRGQEMFDSTNPNAISDVERDLLVRGYEQLHPENAKMMNDFLADVISDGSHDDDVQNIKYLSYAAGEPYNTILFKYLPNISIADYKVPVGDTQYYNDNAIYVSLDTNSALNDPRGAYSTFFHEIAHGIDARLAKDGLSNSAILDATIEKDVRNQVRANIAGRFPHPPSVRDLADIEIILNSLMNKVTTTGDPALDIIRTQVKDDFKNNILNGPINNTASDTYGGVTNTGIIQTDSAGNPILNKDGHNIYIHNIEGDYKHNVNSNGSDYWGNHNPSIEFFANAFSRNITQYTDALDSVNNNFPDAAPAFKQLITDVSK